MIRALHHPAAREVRGYLILGALAALAVARIQELRSFARSAVHKAAALVPEPEQEHDDADA